MGLLGLFESTSRLRDRLDHLARPAGGRAWLRRLAAWTAAAAMVLFVMPMGALWAADDEMITTDEVIQAIRARYAALDGGRAGVHLKSVKHALPAAVVDRLAGGPQPGPDSSAGTMRQMLASRMEFDVESAVLFRQDPTSLKAASNWVVTKPDTGESGTFRQLVSVRDGEMTSYTSICSAVFVLPYEPNNTAHVEEVPSDMAADPRCEAFRGLLAHIQPLRALLDHAAPVSIERDPGNGELWLLRFGIPGSVQGLDAGRMARSAVAWINSARGYAPDRIEYYDAAGQLVSRKAFSEWKEVTPGVWVPYLVETELREFADDQGVPVKSKSRVSELKGLEVNVALADGDFDVQLPENVELVDEPR
jgi:hypothetical protein